MSKIYPLNHITIFFFLVTIDMIHYKLYSDCYVFFFKKNYKNDINLIKQLNQCIQPYVTKITPKTTDQVFFISYLLKKKKQKKWSFLARKETAYKHHLDLCHASNKTTTQTKIYKKKNGQKSHAQNKYF